MEQEESSKDHAPLFLFRRPPEQNNYLKTINKFIHSVHFIKWNRVLLWENIALIIWI